MLLADSTVNITINDALSTFGDVCITPGTKEAFDVVAFIFDKNLKKI
jgi:hypothetical protein